MIVAFVFALVAWIFLFVYEIQKAKEGITEDHRPNPHFVIGTICLLGSFGIAAAADFSFEPCLFLSPTLRICLGAFCLLLSVAFYVYILFFSFGYGEMTTNGNTYSGGVYSKCRHPGFYAFLFFSLSFALLTGSVNVLWFCLFQTAVNTLYIVLQDLFFFPKYLKDYDIYKKKVRFI